MRVTELLYDIFFSRLGHHAQARYDGNNVTYAPSPGQPGQTLLEAHIRGEVVLGAYQLTPQNTVNWICWDVDSTVGLDEARRLTNALCECLEGVPHAVEFSGSKGYHVWVFLDEPVEASLAKHVGDSLRDMIGAPKRGELHIEVYPKQERLTESNPYGNLIKLPLSEHPRTHEFSRFVDRTNGWESGDPIDPQEVLLQRVEFEELSATLKEQSNEEKLINSIVPHWATGDRHNMALYLAGFLASLGWIHEDVDNLVTEICLRANDRETANRLQAVKDTFKRVAEGESVEGFRGLAEALPPNVLKDVIQLAGGVVTDPSVVAIDRIRLDKGPAFLKVRTAARVILANMRDNGRILRDQDELLWLDEEKHRVISLSSPDWVTLLHNRHGINQQEGFGRQLLEELNQSAVPLAEPVQAYRRSYWDGETLYVNLGGEEVYRITPDGITAQLNGQQGMIFRNHEDGMRMPNLLEQPNLQPVDPWSFLVDDVSFGTTDAASATPEEQAELAKAWILSVFFGEAMPTRPILTALGPAGSGKTTFARRILRVLEGPTEDVLGLASDKPDSLRASLTRHKVLVLDNLEKTRAHWLLDMLNRVSTGSHIEIRKLYKTNEVVKIRPDSFVICTAIEMPFSEESLFSRMLPVEMDRLLRPKPEYYLQKLLRDNQRQLWFGLLTRLQQAVTSLNENTTISAPTDVRLADFASFVVRLQGGKAIEGATALSGLQSLGNRQRRVLEQSSPFVVALEGWMQAEPQEAEQWRSVADLYSVLSRFAQRNNLEWRWRSPQGLSQHVRMLEPQLVRHYGMEKDMEYVTAQGRDQQVYRFSTQTIDVANDSMLAAMDTMM